MNKPLVISSNRVAEHDPLTRLDYDNFSYREILSGETVRILGGQQMFVVRDQIIEGELVIEGSLILEELLNESELPVFPENFSYSAIAAQKIVEVPAFQQMFVVSPEYFKVEGELRLDGSLVLDQIEDTPFDPIILPDDNFSFKEIPTGSSKTVFSGQQMIIDGILIVEGSLNIEGQVSLISDERDEPLQPYIIVDGEVFKIKAGRQLFSTVGLIVDGYLQNEGLMAIGA